VKELLGRPKVAVSVVFVMAMFMSIMDITIVNVALPSIGRNLHARADSLDAVAIGYLVSLAVVIPASGWLGDRFGAKRILLTAILVFTAASMLCGAAQTFSQLVGFRVLQGVGGGMLAPVGMTMLFRAFPPAERVRASSILTTPTALAPALGPVLGGILVDNLSWRWCFYVNLPLGILAFAYGLVFLKDQPLPAAGRFDTRGFLLSGTGFAGLMYGVSEGPGKGWSHPDVYLSTAIGTLLLTVLVVTQLQTAEPLLNLRVFTDRLFRSASASLFLSTAAFLGVLYLVALFFQNGLGLTALNSGLSTAPEAIGVMVGAQVATRLLYPRFGPRRLMIGGLLMVGTTIGLMSQIQDRSQLWQMRGLMFLLGYAMAHNFVSAQAAAFARISPADTGRASTLFNALRQLGAASGVAVLTSALTISGVQAGRQGGATDLHPYHVAFLVSALLAVAGAAFAATIKDSDADATRTPLVTRSRQTSRAGTTVTSNGVTSSAVSSPDARSTST
jgi:EmrB/QacA subfamily drug resistance transporter